MKKSIIISSFDSIHNPHYAGGGAIAVHEVAKHLSRTYEVTVLSGKYSGATGQTIDGIRYEYVGVASLGPLVGQLLFHLALAYHVLTRNFDLWIESFTPPFSTSCTPWYTKKPVIALVHMLSAQEMERKYHMPFSYIENFGLRWYKHFIVLTQESATKIRACNPEARIEIIGNGVHLPDLMSEQSERKNLAFIGRLEIEQKGIDLLLEAYAKASEQITIPLVIGGSGSKEETERVRSLVTYHNLQDRVTLLGRIEGEQKEAFLRHALIGVVPSRYETFSMVALEMMSHQVPIVAFDIHGLSWASKESMERVPPFDIDAFAQKIVHLYRDADMRKKVSIAARKVAEEYSWEHIGEKYASYIRQIQQPYE